MSRFVSAQHRWLATERAFGPLCHLSVKLNSQQLLAIRQKISTVLFLVTSITGFPRMEYWYLNNSFVMPVSLTTHLRHIVTGAFLCRV